MSVSKDPFLGYTQHKLVQRTFETVFHGDHTTALYKLQLLRI